VRVLMITNSYPPVLGGLQTAAHNIARGLVRRGHEVRVVSQRHPLNLPARETMDGVRVQRWVCLSSDPHDLVRGQVGSFLGGVWLSPVIGRRLVRLMDSFHPDVVNAHFPEAFVPFLLRLRRQVPYRLVVSLHGHDVERWDAFEIRTNAAAFRGFSELLQVADSITGCSTYLLEEAARLVPSVAEKAQTIHNGIDPERFSQAEAYVTPWPYVLAYGRLTKKKGFDLLLEAFAQLGSRHHQIHLIVAGEGEEEKALLAQASRLGLADRVSFLGRATEEEVVRLLMGCLFVVVPSRREPFGIVVLEALGAGKSVLATRVGGVDESVSEFMTLGPPLSLTATRAVSGKNPTATAAQGIRAPMARLVEPTVGGLAHAIEEWLAVFERDPSAFNRACPALPERLSWEGVVDRYEEVLSGTA
jgi:glycosyltransferase involved in cell wall biosynthesis